MKKIKQLFCIIFVICLTTMTGCKNEDTTARTYATVSEANQSINTGRGDALTKGEIYDYLRENNVSLVNNSITIKGLKAQLDFSKQATIDLYSKYLNEEFQTKFVDNEVYEYNDAFSEDELVKYLKSENYTINCGGTSTAGYLNDEYFSCDYSDYIEKELNYDIYLKMIKIKYIIEENPTLIDKSQARKITYYSISRSSTTDYKTLENLETALKSISTNYNSEDVNLIRDIEDLAINDKKEDLEQITTDYNKISTSSDSGFSQLKKFTTCGEKRCTLEEGKSYQEKLLNEKDYLVDKLVIKGDSDILDDYDDAVEVLFSEDMSDKLYEIGGKKYLISPIHINDAEKSINDIILFNSSKYYIVLVETIDSNSDNTQKILVAEKLIDRISDDTVLKHYLHEEDIKVYDKKIKEYFDSILENSDE